jgi:hypothetical protein
MKKFVLVLGLVSFFATSCKKETTASPTTIDDERDKLVGTYEGVLEVSAIHTWENPNDFTKKDTTENVDPVNITLKVSKLNESDLTFTVVASDGSMTRDFKISTSKIEKSQNGYLFKINNFNAGETPYQGNTIEGEFHGYKLLDNSGINGNDFVLSAVYKDKSELGFLYEDKFVTYDTVVSTMYISCKKK